jgi:thymidine phosphorylase
MDVVALLRRKREGHRLGSDELRAFGLAIADQQVADAQLGAFAMAVCLRSMSSEETRDWTLAMRDSGQRLDWSDLKTRGPILDKHSTGGVGDTVSLMLGPMLAACGAYVPMLSGRGLGHTGGTLDKLEAIPGYAADVSTDRLRAVVAETGLAIVAANADLAPADRRLYAVRDVTATVDSLPLITASILSKKLAAGTDALVLDVKHGSGATLPDPAAARELAEVLSTVANAAGLPTRVLLTDMNQPLAPALGNAIEVDVARRYLQGRERPARLHEVTLALGAELLCLAQLTNNADEARTRLMGVLDSGAAADRFARMVHALGGPLDVFQCELPRAPFSAPVYPLRAGVVNAMDARHLGQVVIGLGGGRRVPADRIDPRVGLSHVVALGQAIDTHHPLAIVHAADAGDYARAAMCVREAISVGDSVASPGPLWQPLHAETVA